MKLKVKIKDKNFILPGFPDRKTLFYRSLLIKNKIKSKKKIDSSMLGHTCSHAHPCRAHNTPFLSPFSRHPSHASPCYRLPIKESKFTQKRGGDEVTDGSGEKILGTVGVHRETGK